MGGNGKINKQKREDLQKICEMITGKAIDNGHIVEMGFAAFLVATYDDWQKMSAQQLDDLRSAFFGGGHHLFQSIMMTLDTGLEPTERDMRRMAMIHHELDTFIDDFAKRHGITFPGAEPQQEQAH